MEDVSGAAKYQDAAGVRRTFTVGSVGSTQARRLALTGLL